MCMFNIAQAMRLYLITDDKARSPADLADRVARGIDGGATAVQFREKNGGITMCARAFELIALRCHEAQVPLFLNADLIGRFEPQGPFAGYQYSDRTLPLHPSAGSTISGYSAHAPADAESAFSHGAHFCTLSPIFPTPSKVGILDAIGVESITECRRLLPDGIIVALGGIDETNGEACLKAGASGLAVIRAIMGADDPEKAARRLRAIVENCVNS
jgi:thiamine-phosphate pyrophosphorylase